jgi:hypothetical protein
MNKRHRESHGAPKKLSTGGDVGRMTAIPKPILPNDRRMSPLRREEGGEINKWMQDVHPKKGALHRALHIPEDKKIPTQLLQKKAQSPNDHIKKMANLALRYRGKSHGGRTTSPKKLAGGGDAWEEGPVAGVKDYNPYQQERGGSASKAVKGKAMEVLNTGILGKKSMGDLTQDTVNKRAMFNKALEAPKLSEAIRNIPIDSEPHPYDRNSRSMKNWDIEGMRARLKAKSQGLPPPKSPSRLDPAYVASRNAIDRAYKDAAYQETINNKGVDAAFMRQYLDDRARQEHAEHSNQGHEWDARSNSWVDKTPENAWGRVSETLPFLKPLNTISGNAIEKGVGAGQSFGEGDWKNGLLGSLDTAMTLGDFMANPGQAIAQNSVNYAMEKAQEAKKGGGIGLNKRYKSFNKKDK